MFEYIQGNLVQASPTHVTVDVHGIGYRIHIPFNNYAKLPALKTHSFFFICTVIREDSHKLFGFLSEHERDLFEQLIDISGIGPKTALALIGHMELQELQSAIGQGNIAKVCKIPGIGKKTAERLIVEMRDKIFKIRGTDSLSEPLSQSEPSIIQDAMSALVNLGYHTAQAQKAVKAAMQACDAPPTLAALITSALRYM
jgi:holliday junction DNA helicase RuvA